MVLVLLIFCEHNATSISWESQVCLSCYHFIMLLLNRKLDSNVYEVNMDDAAIVVGQYGLPVEMETKITMELL